MSEAPIPRVLAVEDNPDTRLLLRHLLQPRFELALAGRVTEALSVARERSFDVLLLDVNLGEEQTGVDLLRILREMPEHARTPAIALTAYALPGDRERFLAAGFEGYLSKPFTRGDLWDAITAVLRPAGG